MTVAAPRTPSQIADFDRPGPAARWTFPSCALVAGVTSTALFLIRFFLEDLRLLRATSSPFKPRRLTRSSPLDREPYSNAKMRFQSFLMSTTIHPFAAAASKALSRRPKDLFRS